MLLDSNIIIYAALGESDVLLEFVRKNSPFISAVSRVEVLGFHKITADEIAICNKLFAATTILPVSDEVLDEAIRLRQQRKITLGDSVIAATAIVNDLPLVTRNTKDFKWISNLELIDPFETQGQ